MTNREQKTRLKPVLAALLLTILLAIPAILYNTQHPNGEEKTVLHGSQKEEPKIEFRRIVLKPKVRVYINGVDYTDPEEDPFGPFMVILLCHLLGCHPTALALIDETLVADNTICMSRYEPPLLPFIDLDGVLYRATINYDEGTNTIVFVATIPDYIFNVRNVTLDFIGMNTRCTAVYIPLSEPVNITPESTVVVALSLPREMPAQNITSLLSRLAAGDRIYNTNASIDVCHHNVCSRVSAAALEVLNKERLIIRSNTTSFVVVNATVMITIPFIANGATTIRVQNSGVTVLEAKVETSDPTVFIVTVPLNVYDVKSSRTI